MTDHRLYCALYVQSECTSTFSCRCREEQLDILGCDGCSSDALQCSSPAHWHSSLPWFQTSPAHLHHYSAPEQQLHPLLHPQPLNWATWSLLMLKTTSHSESLPILLLHSAPLSLKQVTWIHLASSRHGVRMLWTLLVSTPREGGWTWASIINTCTNVYHKPDKQINIQSLHALVLKYMYLQHQ